MNIYDEDVLEITNNSKYSLDKTSSEEKLSVTLTVHNLNEDNDTGTYWCRAFLLDGSMLISPFSFELKTSDMYTSFPCRVNVTIKNSVSACARIITPTPTTVYDVSSPLPTNMYTLLSPTTVGSTKGITQATGPTSVYFEQTVPSGSTQLPILYIVVGLVGFLTLICVLLALVICLLCKRVRIRGK